MEEKIDLRDLTQISGIGSQTSQKLKENGFLNIMSIAATTPGILKDLAGVSEVAARKMINNAREICKLGFELGINVEKKQEANPKISTHCESVDKLLGGGLELGTSMEAFSEFAGGKSSLAHLLSVSCLKQFPESYIVWIDSESTFRPSRIRDFCKGLEVDPEKVLSHIKTSVALSSDHQILLTDQIEKEIDSGVDIKLVIIDSLTNHFRAEFQGRSTLANRQQLLNNYLHKLSKLSDMYNVAVYVTNQVQSDPGQLYGDTTKPVGGHILGHYATTRIYLRKSKQGSRVMKLIDSPNLPPGEAYFMIETDKWTSLEGKDDKE
jgi:DNA repair protein RadA